MLAFPDEDVLIGTRFIDPGAFQAFKGLEDICPRPGHKPSGEERAWSRRLAKRFGAEGRIDDRTFIVTGDGNAAGVLRLRGGSSPRPSPADVAALFEPLDHERGDVLIAFGWAMAEDLASKYAPSGPGPASAPGAPGWSGRVGGASRGSGAQGRGSSASTTLWQRPSIGGVRATSRRSPLVGHHARAAGAVHARAATWRSRHGSSRSCPCQPNRQAR